MKNSSITLLNISEQQFQDFIANAITKTLDKSSLEVYSLSVEDKTIWMSRIEASKYLKISLPILDKLTKQGKLIAHRVGRKKLYNKNDINQAINNLKIKY